jgi:hypothetical protein
VLFYFNQNIDTHYILAEKIRKKIIPVSPLSGEESALKDETQLMFYQGGKLIRHYAVVERLFLTLKI